MRFSPVFKWILRGSACTLADATIIPLIFPYQVIEEDEAKSRGLCKRGLWEDGKESFPIFFLTENGRSK